MGGFIEPVGAEVEAFWVQRVENYRCMPVFSVVAVDSIEGLTKTEAAVHASCKPAVLIFGINKVIVGWVNQHPETIASVNGVPVAELSGECSQCPEVLCPAIKSFGLLFVYFTGVKLCDRQEFVVCPA